MSRLYKKYDKAIGGALAVTAVSLTVPGRVAATVATTAISAAATVASN